MSQKAVPVNFEDTRLLIFNKYVDWSILHEGVSIPLRFHQSLLTAIGKDLKRGEKQAVKVSLDGKIYSALLTNIEFDQARYPDHCDIIQFRWSKGSLLAKELRRVFFTSYNELFRYRAHKKQPGLEKPEIKETITFLFNPRDQIIDIEYVTAGDFTIAKDMLTLMPGIRDMITWLDGSLPFEGRSFNYDMCSGLTAVSN